MNERSKAQEGIIYEGIRSQIVERIAGLLGGERRRCQVPQEIVKEMQADISEISGWNLPPIKKLTLSPREEVILFRRLVVGFLPPKIGYERGSVLEKGLLVRATFYDDEEIARELHDHEVSGPDEMILDIAFSFEGFNPRLGLTLYSRRTEKNRTRKVRLQDLEFTKKLLDVAQPVT